MGLLFSRSRDQSPADILVLLEANIKELEGDTRNKHYIHRRMSKCCLMLFIMIYAIVFIMYMVNAPELNWSEWMLYAMLLFIAVPVLFIIIRIAIHTYYARALANNRIKLIEKREVKKRILTQVKNSAQVANSILNKYDDLDEDMKPLI